MFVYVLAATTDLTANAAAGTDTTHASLRPPAAPARSAWLRAIQLIGRMAGATVLNAIQFRAVRYSATSSGGTAATPQPVGEDVPAADTAAVLGGTISSGTAVRTVMAADASASGPGAFVATDEEQEPSVGQPGGSGSMDFISSATVNSALFRPTITFVER